MRRRRNICTEYINRMLLTLVVNALVHEFSIQILTNIEVIIWRISTDSGLNSTSRWFFRTKMYITRFGWIIEEIISIERQWTASRWIRSLRFLHLTILIPQRQELVAPLMRDEHPYANAQRLNRILSFGAYRVINEWLTINHSKLEEKKSEYYTRNLYCHANDRLIFIRFVMK